jgi:two-component system sensor histidine kinase HydH
MTDLLMYARPPRPETRQIDVRELLDALVAFFRADPAWGRLDVAVEGNVGTLPADPELLKVAFQNLLLNAAQASDLSGRVTVRLHQADGFAQIDVSDSGGGIHPEVRAKLFTPFFTTKARGTGLGLATVRRIAEAHGGHIEILSSGADGTTMRLTLPSVARGKAVGAVRE